MKLYHNGMSTCSQKVRLVLAEKGLEFDSQVMDLQKGDQFSPEYQQLNPTALVPTLEDQGNIYIESSLINYYLDEAYPNPHLKPDSAAERYHMRTLIKQIDEVQHPACSVITYAIGLRPVMLKKDPAVLQSLIEQIKDPARREGRRAVVEQGIHAPVFRVALLEYLNVMQAADAMLSNSTWTAGETFSLSDCALAPYVLRLEHLGQLTIIEQQMPNLARWYNTIQSRPGYQRAITDWLPEKAVSMFTAGGKDVQQDVAAMAG